MYKLLLVTLESCTCWFSSSQRASAESLARRQNAVVPTYSNDIVLLSLTPTLLLLYRSSSNLRLFLASVPAGPLAPADLSSYAEYDVVTNDIVIDGPLRCSSWFSFDVPADPSSSSSACSWIISFQLIHYAPAGSTWPPPDFEPDLTLDVSIVNPAADYNDNQTNC
ncbi:hypothetical protein F511_21862 [Dorcoceras hygrometricum]|uniref:Uncharacterized protein n=1 Tax=Dorcoceras hygrometricum TaxID=472368 RepID=A0A2Z7CTF8_9LAMI|nr:hypothetical protein F511_21862 [Dorcoceras hygrometricum]